MARPPIVSVAATAPAGMSCPVCHGVKLSVRLCTSGAHVPEVDYRGRRGRLDFLCHACKAHWRGPVRRWSEAEYSGLAVAIEKTGVFVEPRTFGRSLRASYAMADILAERMETP
ncbi:MAG: hypothetical protein GX616_26180 [Planctomycetes bacterium]|nr:hypothetical protein [Planctomycetota bacterium]